MIRSAGFPGGDADTHLRSIPACAALGLRQLVDSGVAALTIHGSLPAVRDPVGRIDRGAALVLADQAGANGIFATLPEPSPMMTLNLRLDWCAPLPVGVLTCAIDEVVREGDLALVRGHLTGADGFVGTMHGRYLLGSAPGGGGVDSDLGDRAQPAEERESFAAYLGATASGDGWVLTPRADHVGARRLPAFHGGVIAALLERAGIAAVDPAFRPIDVDVRYLAPARADRALSVRAIPRRLGRRAATVDVEAWQGDDPGRIVALARMTFVSDSPAPVTVLRRWADPVG